MTLTSGIRFVLIVFLTFHCIFQDNIEKSGRYEFYCGPDDADDASPVAFCVQVRIGKGLTN